MLSQIKLSNSIEVPYIGGGPIFPIVTFDLPTNEPFNFAHINHTITAGATILLGSFTIRNLTGAVIFFLGIIPWQFVGTTISSVTMQTPNPNNTPLFATNVISGYIPKEFHVFDGWTIQFATFGADPGASITSTLSLNKVWRNSDYN